LSLHLATHGAKFETGISYVPTTTHTSYYYHTTSFDTNLLTMASEKTPTYTDHDGYKLAKGFPLDGFRSGLEYEAKDEDLFIVTYPKV